MMTNEKTAILIEMTCHNDDKLPRNPQYCDLYVAHPVMPASGGGERGVGEGRKEKEKERREETQREHPYGISTHARAHARAHTHTHTQHDENALTVSLIQRKC